MARTIVPPLTQERLRELLYYDPETGIFTWRVDRSVYRCSGKIAGKTVKTTRVYIRIEYRSYAAHRLAFLYMLGEWPKNEVDHRDGNPANNRWSNLRQADRLINCQNRVSASKNNKVGLLGVQRIGDRFYARIYAAGKVTSLGGFATAEEAHAAYLKAKRRLHPGCTI